MVLDGKVDDARYEGSDALLNEERCIEGQMDAPMGSRRIGSQLGAER